MYVMEEHIRPRILGKLLAVLFSLFMLGASLGMGNMTQANSNIRGFAGYLSDSTGLTGGILFLLCLLILTGGSSLYWKSMWFSCTHNVCGLFGAAHPCNPDQY